MAQAFRLFRIFEIDIKIHVSFFLLPLFFGFFYSAHYGWAVGLRAACLVFLVFACILAHELAHSLKAKKLGIAVPEITLYLIGGVASMQSIPREPWKEFWISVVGPLFNFVLALVLFFPLYWTIGKENLFSPGLASWPQMLANVFWINPILAVFNLIPAFPMDGGRILRSLLAVRMNYLKATQISAFLGRLFAILFLFMGIWMRHWMLILIALFIYFSASGEERRVWYEESHRRVSP
ncbi:MAG: site-2 protease family protein [Candidatus Omnitrophica bacterium]|nr:site-2 protease family protein [Candidatus Omnitrophota bacterium]